MGLSNQKAVATLVAAHISFIFLSAFISLVYYFHYFTYKMDLNALHCVHEERIEELNSAFLRA